VAVMQLPRLKQRPHLLFCQVCKNAAWRLLLTLLTLLTLL
jgi:hypothetical protein